MDANRKDDWRLAEEAAGWLIRMEDDDSVACRTEFVAWAKASSRHVEELLIAQAIWREFTHIDPSRQIDLRELPTANEESLVALNVTGDPSSFHLPAREERPRTARRWVALAACVAIGAIAWGWLNYTETRPRLYTTDHGDHDTIDLSDGSVMYLNTESRARVQFSGGIRQVRLLAGEALFVVEEDRARPFKVITDDATIQVTSTQFNVYQRANATRVSVIDGVVEIEAGRGGTSAESGQPPLKLTAGNEAEISHGRVVQAPIPDVQRAVAWRAGRLVFRGNTLEEVAAEFNRYNSVQIRLEGQDVRTQNIGGVFDADDPQTLVDFVADELGLEVAQTGDEIVIRSRERG
jgi:transmembrane sensor